MAEFQWTAKRTAVAQYRAEGYTQQEAADMAGVSVRSVIRWEKLPEFSEEVDRLVLMMGVALKSERVKIAKRAVRKVMEGEKWMVTSDGGVLPWLKYMQGETDGIKLDLTRLLDALGDDDPGDE